MICRLLQSVFQFVVILSLVCCGGVHAAQSVQSLSKYPLASSDYSFGYWQNGFRKHRDDTSPDVLCVETGRYGFALDMARIDQARIGLLQDALDYAGALDAAHQRIQDLGEAELHIELEKNGKVYRAISSRAAEERKNGERFQSTRLWESGRYVQNFEIQGLRFQAADGEQLDTDSNLRVIAWPDSLSLTAEVMPAVKYQTGPHSGVRGKGMGVIEKPHIVSHREGLENERFSVETWINIPESFYRKTNGWILCKNRNEVTEGNYGFSVNRGRVTATMNIGGRGKQNRFTVKTSPHALQAGKWHHLTMSYDGESFSLFVDGRVSGSVKIGKKRQLGNGDLWLGKRSDGHGRMAPVIVDQLRVWNRALTPSEIARHAKRPGEIRNREGLTYENNFESGPPVVHPVWENARLSIRLKGSGFDWHTAQNFPGLWKVGEMKKLTLNCQAKPGPDASTRVLVAMRLNKLPPVSYDKELSCYVARVNRPKRDWQTGYSPLRNYDEIDITVDSDKEKTIPFLVEMINPAGITGLCPVLCDSQGVPTGISVQLSKNWHYRKMGSYLRAYTMLPTVKGRKHYKLRIIYGYYGKVPSASHAQLSLVGYGGNGRWDQLAIGAWGETYCMDMDMSCVDVAVTDVRMLMARNGKEGKKWSWTDAGWGGDWLGLHDAGGRKYLFHGVKASYLAHGPCLTEVRYRGFYGAHREVGLASTVRTLRTNDYARTFTTLRYDFKKTVSADGWLFKMGRTRDYVTPIIAYGNASGLIKQHRVPDGLKSGSDFLPRTSLTGAGPWWVAFPGAFSDNDRTWGTGYRAMVIRSYRVVAGGKEYRTPAVEFSAHRPTGEKSNLDFLLTAPVGVSEFRPGDRVELEVEWITLPRVADDYYGSNETFRRHLAANPASWKTSFREAVGNDLRISVDGGQVIKKYPVIIQCQKENVVVSIEAGVGYVPVRFQGLEHARGYTLYRIEHGKKMKVDQSVHGNDFWQTDYQVRSRQFNRTYNLPLDGVDRSRWLLQRTE